MKTLLLVLLSLSVVSSAHANTLTTVGRAASEFVTTVPNKKKMLDVLLSHQTDAQIVRESATGFFETEILKRMGEIRSTNGMITYGKGVNHHGDTAFVIEISSPSDRILVENALRSEGISGVTGDSRKISFALRDEWQKYSGNSLKEKYEKMIININDALTKIERASFENRAIQVNRVRPSSGISR